MKVPVGKHCGFVQFVRKPDAERAIEKMQGFPIGGSRIRLSWGRSQCMCKLSQLPSCLGRSSLHTTDKAAQAAAQAAQAAAYQAQYQVQMASPNASSLTAEQAMQLLEKFGITQFLNNPAPGGNANSSANANGAPQPNLNVSTDTLQATPTTAEQAALDMINSHFDAFAPPSFDQQRPGSQFNAPAFSPFSPDPNYVPDSVKNRENLSINPGGQSQSYPSSAKGYAPWYSSSQQDEKMPASATSASGKVSPTSAHASRPASARAFGNFLGDQSLPFPPPNRASSRQEGPIARPDLSRRASHALPLSSQDQFAAQENHDRSLHDLNGTLASLNLGENQLSWKTGDGSASAS